MSNIVFEPKIDLSGTTTPSQSGLGSNSNEGAPRIAQSSNITGASPSDSLVSYLGHLWAGVLPHPHP